MHIIILSYCGAFSAYTPFRCKAPLPMLQKLNALYKMIALRARGRMFTMWKIGRILGIVMAAAGLASPAVAQVSPYGEYPPCPNNGGYCIATGNPSFTYFQIGRDLGSIVAPSARFSLMPIEGAGSPDNVRRMRYQTDVKFAIVQSDVLLHFRSLADRGDAEAREIIKPLRVIQPLYTEEVHILARASDGPKNMNFIHELENKRIGTGPARSGHAMTAIAAYQLLFGARPTDNQLMLGQVDDLLSALANNQIDAVILVAGQPFPRLKELSPAAKEHIKLLALDPNHPSTARLLRGPYGIADIRAENYTWITEDVRTFSVKSYLISQVYANDSTRKAVRDFTRSLCQRLPELQRSGHPKWQQVRITTEPLPGGWEYSPDAMDGLNSVDCRQNGASPPPYGNPPGGASRVCSQADIVLMTPGCRR